MFPRDASTLTQDGRALKRVVKLADVARPLVAQQHLARFWRKTRGRAPRRSAEFLQEFSRSTGCSSAGLSPEAREMLLGYEWPGNVRELHNALERAAILCEGGRITGEHLSLGA